MEKEIVNYSNPRRAATIEGWPWGRKQRATARFWVETHPKRGERVGRALTDPTTGDTCATKYTTYSKAARIVDGDNGRTYLIELGLWSDSIRVVCGDMKYDAAHIPNSSPRFAEVRALFEAEALTTDPPKGGEVVAEDETDSHIEPQQEAGGLPEPETTREFLEMERGGV